MRSRWKVGSVREDRRQSTASKPFVELHPLYLRECGSRRGGVFPGGIPLGTGESSRGLRWRSELTLLQGR